MCFVFWLQSDGTFFRADLMMFITLYVFYTATLPRLRWKRRDKKLQLTILKIARQSRFSLFFFLMFFRASVYANGASCC